MVMRTSHKRFSKSLLSQSLKHPHQPLATFSSTTNNTKYSNVPSHIWQLNQRKLYKNPDHPIGILWNLVTNYFKQDKQLGILPSRSYVHRDDFNPIVSTKQCFDDLLIPKDHVSRQLSDNYYISEDTLLRPHTSAHQTEMMRAGHEAFLVLGDVYRRDAIDKTHFPAFHQIEGVKIVNLEELGTTDPQKALEIVNEDLKAVLEGLSTELFGETKQRWVDAYFPFTDPSLELEIFFEEDWLEVLGSGVIEPEVIRNGGMDPEKVVGWAFGLGLERLSMRLFNIPDIRLFWSQDARFLKQFKAGQITQFESYSKYPPCFKDVSFWLPSDFSENDFFEVLRNHGGDLIEEADCIDAFTHPKTNKSSKCFRICYRHMDRSVTHDEINTIQDKIRDDLQTLGYELR
eukprot:CAMPEP_0115014852 /NCGR_PEP_ID=MMETSP0216-20121206/26358_1 /TAXON_ID=223996 /ORGANISM="Protocruzia adherens, Strain Boccale" /LENGTH=400 /DNA_ID=CAMNT_0002384737 /DNA_START=29 /DNA_END=1231 /DNA_ORIENTATION=+